jgi:hypothetical protein
MRITARRYLLATGFAPGRDDLDRCNCVGAGSIGHFFCGWCTCCDKPRFICGHEWTGEERDDVDSDPAA